jgi:hypothetical protein
MSYKYSCGSRLGALMSRCIMRQSRLPEYAISPFQDRAPTLAEWPHIFLMRLPTPTSPNGLPRSRDSYKTRPQRFLGGEACGEVHVSAGSRSLGSCRWWWCGCWCRVDRRVQSGAAVSGLLQHVRWFDF